MIAKANAGGQVSDATVVEFKKLVANSLTKQGIQLANDTCQGLSAYAMTRDIGRVFRLGERIENASRHSRRPEVERLGQRARVRTPGCIP